MENKIRDSQLGISIAIHIIHLGLKFSINDN